MKITLKLYATLGELLPDHAHENTVEIEVEDNATPNQVIDHYRVPRKMAYLILLNGIYIAPDERDKPLLEEGDAFAVWPPVAGG